MRKSTFALLTVGACILIVACVVAGMFLYLFGVSASGLMRSSGYEKEPLSKDIIVVDESVEWKVVAPSDDRHSETRIAFKFTLRNPTNEDIRVSVFELRIRFFDAEGFALERYNWADALTVPANGEYTYSASHDLRGSLGKQVAYIEVLGKRSKQ